ncbi:transposase [Kribbella sp. CA-247076]|uniref:transposase n=1 Tax=Kribbella sp. CA-247076 TaxID=3239941 RepID=UPI003D93B8F4
MSLAASIAAGAVFDAAKFYWGTALNVAVLATQTALGKGIAGAAAHRTESVDPSDRDVKGSEWVVAGLGEQLAKVCARDFRATLIDAAERWGVPRLLDRSSCLRGFALMAEKRRRFSPQFKAEAVQVVVEVGRFISDVARDLGIERKFSAIRYNLAKMSASPGSVRINVASLASR